MGRNKDDGTDAMSNERVSGRTMRSLTQTIQDLSEEFSTSTVEVQRILSSEIDHLGQNANVRDFVPILAIKRVKEVLRKNARPRQAVQGRRRAA